ncbi:MAG: hypothetical protein WA799_04685 [Nitrosotalea sp.]
MGTFWDLYNMGLNYYEKQLVKVLDANPTINTRKFIKLSGVGKTRFYEHSQILEASGYIAFTQVKNQRIWNLVRQGKKDDPRVDLEESVLEKRYDTIESKVMQSLGKIRKGKITDKIDVYGDAVVLILATLGSMKLVSIYRRKRVTPSYAKFVKRLELLLEKISDSKFFSDYGFGRTAIDLIAYEVETKLDEFLGIKQDKKDSIY